MKKHIKSRIKYSDIPRHNWNLGIREGELSLMMAGYNVGKSIFNKHVAQKLEDNGQVYYWEWLED